jgi:hypothetical protein
MRFLVEHRGRVVDAAWLSRGPDRGMRPEMLRPEIEGMLRRRRVYDPGESGQRAVGESWSGEDVRIVDGQPVSLTFQSRLVGWATVQGVETVEIRSELKSSAYSGTETAWVHAASAVPIRIAREVRYSVRDERGAEAWSDRSRYVLIKVSGGE